MTRKNKNMNRLINLKRIEIEGPLHTIAFDYRYVTKKNKAVLDKSISFARKFRLDNEWEDTPMGDLTFSVVEVETEAGYLNNSYPDATPLHWNELSRKEISYEDLLKEFDK